MNTFYLKVKEEFHLEQFEEYLISTFDQKSYRYSKTFVVILQKMKLTIQNSF